MVERRAISVDGIVQGVGFRPFVHGRAASLHLQGFVRNQTGNVRIEVEGERGSLDLFLAELTHPPPLAQIERVFWSAVSPRGDARFSIDASEIDPDGQVLISPDVATCGDCLAEALDPADRRYRYPFLNCTHCGPRLTIITGSPYDRPRTTMAGFALCPECREEYEDPADRRFHAPPICCRRCGPALRLLDDKGARVAADDPLAAFVRAIRAGRIGAMKGVGGYHLICDASSESAVAELRRRKHRDEKPLAVMFPPEALRAATAACRNLGVWPVLVGAPGEQVAMLAAPIILYDYPQIAPESPGDLFDATAEEIAPLDPREARA